MAGENFSNLGCHITGKCICKSDILDIFTHVPQAKFSPRWRKITDTPQAGFCWKSISSPAEKKGGGTMKPVP